jgi:hypothetical protein
LKRKLLLFVSVVLLLAVPAMGFADSDEWDSVYDGGDFIISASVGAYFPFILAISPQMELIIAQVKIGEIMPLDFGVAARGEITLGSTLRFGAGGLATAHLTFANLQGTVVPWLENFDFFVSLGIGVSIWPDSSVPINLRFITVEGISYWLNDAFGLKIETSYWNFYGTSIGAMIKL